MGAATVHEQIAALAASASTALVQAMTTDGWTALRDRLAKLFGRGNRDDEQRASGELERSCTEIAEAPDTDRPEVRAGVEALWRERLRRRLEEDPDLAEELQNLLAEAAPADGDNSRYGRRSSSVPGTVQIGGGDRGNGSRI